MLRFNEISLHHSLTEPTVTPVVRKDLCFRQILSDNCILPLSNNLTKSSCCCGEVAGAGWSSNCLTCPLQDSSKDL